MSWSDGLTGKAFDVAATNDSPLRVMAGPGTGKSFAMKRRVARLLEEGVDPERILAVTFTRNAAKALVDDLHALGIPGCERIWAGTLHGFCFSLLQRAEVLAHLQRVPRPLVTFQSSGVLRFEAAPMLEDLAGLGGARDNTKRIHAFEAAWARRQSDKPGWPPTADQAFHHALLKWLSFHRAMLIGEVIPEALRYLQNNPTAPVLTQFLHVVVDEYQDLNRAEQDLVDLIAGNGASAIVGDEDQSIYRFRHANPEGISQYGQTHANTHDEPLVECRRCPTSVVAVADHLIRQNHPAGTAPRLVPMPGRPAGTIHRVQWNSVDEESQGIGRYVEQLVSGGTYAPGDVLILTPRRLLGYAIRDYLRVAKVPVHSFYHEEALESAAAQRSFALLTLLASPHDRVALRWLLQSASSFLSGAYAKVRAHCETTGQEPWDTLVALENGTISIPRTTPLIKPFRALQAELNLLRTLTLQDIVDRLLPAPQAAMPPLREAADLALPACESAQDLFEYLRTVVTQPEMPEEQDFVRIMSAHKSKGLTAKAVIVTGCVDGLIPTIRSAEPPAEQALILREQRRLFYVAITRCTELLVLSSFASIDRSLAYKLGATVTGRYGPAKAITSRFLAELGPSAPPARQGSEWEAAGYQ